MTETRGATATALGGDGPAARHDFEWMTGFECTTFPQIGMDELALTQHDRFWGGDIIRARDAGCRLIRYGIRWNIVSPRPRAWDWSSVDGPMELLRYLGMEPLVDLFHFGVPEWLQDSVLSSMFPDLQSELCRAFVRRYPWVRWYTPTNEPYITAQFTSEHGFWFPFGHGSEQFVKAMRNVARGMSLGWSEIRREQPDARLLVSDTCEFHHPVDEASRSRADWLNERRFLGHELTGGLVGAGHAMRGYLIDNGMSEADLAWFEEHPAPLDVIGLDYYPSSERSFELGAHGEPVGEMQPADRQSGPAELARQYFARLGRPMVFAETHAPGDDATRVAWLHRMVRELRTVRAEGVPVIGMVWWGLIDQVDWASNLRRFDYQIDPTGLYRLEWRGDVLERIPTAALDVWRSYVARPIAESVGQLAPVSWPRGEATLW